MLPGMPAPTGSGDRGVRSIIRAHLALAPDRTWGLSAHLHAWSVDPIWPVVPEEIGRNEPVIARVGLQSDPEIPFETLQISGARLIAIVPDDTDESLVSAASVGAWAAVCEEEANLKMAEVVRNVSEGRCPLLEEVSKRKSAAFTLLGLLREGWNHKSVSVTPSPLSEREVLMLRLVSEGVTNREIATQLILSEQTVKNYMSMVFEKMGTHSRTQAATMALEYGWLRED